MIFQQIEPLVYFLFKHLKKMLVNILRTFIKTEEIKDKKASDIDFFKCSRRQKSAGIEGY